MPFTWTKDLETGNAIIDSEHKELIGAINNLLAACSAGRGRDEITHTVDFLGQYTRKHFTHEQNLQMQYKYPDYINHKNYHDTFVKVVDDIAARLRKEGATLQLVGEINSRLGDWLLNHIKREDVKVAQHIQAAGKK